MQTERILLLGASRGLGAALARNLLTSGPRVQVLGVARKKSLLVELENEFAKNFKAAPLDLSRPEARDQLEQMLFDFNPTRVFYIAGGGPYGPFGEKNFESHEWAWRVTFESAAFLAHQLALKGREAQLILTGSSVCEQSGDSLGASYAAAKHAVLGLYRSLRLQAPLWDVRLFSPGYMDTQMVPNNTATRERRLWSTAEVAQEFSHWAFDPTHRGDHRQFELYPP